MGNQFFRSGLLTDPAFTIPDGVLLPGETVFVRILAVDLDREGDLVFFENRSNLFTVFAPSSVPEPFSILSLGFGLLFLAGLRRTFRNRLSVRSPVKPKETGSAITLPQR